MLWRCALVSETGCLRWVVIFRVTSRQDLRTPCPAHAFCHCERKLGCIETKQIRDESQETGLHSHTNINRIPEAVQPRRLVRKEKAAFLHGENDRTSTFLRATTYNGLKNTFDIMVELSYFPLSVDNIQGQGAGSTAGNIHLHRS
jgi:hypothetical protein